VFDRVVVRRLGHRKDPLTLRSWLLFIHILAAMVWLGGGLILTAIGARIRRSGDDSSIAEFGRTMAYVGPRVLTPAVLAVLVTGIWLVLDNSAWEFGQLWLQVAVGLFAVAFLIGAVYLSRLGGQLQESDQDRTSNDPLQVLGRWMTGYGLVLGILLVILWDMVFKPSI
jgi:uncharacterized membrane protein